MNLSRARRRMIQWERYVSRLAKLDPTGEDVTVPWGFGRAKRRYQVNRGIRRIARVLRQCRKEDRRDRP